MAMAWRDRAKDHRTSSDLSFIVWTAIVMVGLIALSLYVSAATGIAPYQGIAP
jgi:hypothetical protein